MPPSKKAKQAASAKPEGTIPAVPASLINHLCSSHSDSSTGLERTDNNMSLSSWPQIVAINQKNYYTYDPRIGPKSRFSYNSLVSNDYSSSNLTGWSTGITSSEMTRSSRTGYRRKKNERAQPKKPEPRTA